MGTYRKGPNGRKRKRMLNVRLCVTLCASLALLVVLGLSACGENADTSETVAESVEASQVEGESAAEGKSDIATAKELEQKQEEAQAEETVSEDVPSEVEETVNDTDDPQAEIKTTGDQPENKEIALIFFMGQSNMSGCGGNYELAPAVTPGAGYEFRAVTDPFSLHELTEPFGFAENFPGGIGDVPGGKKGSLVSAFVNEYYAQTGIPVVGVSASAGATTTEDWLSDAYVADLSVRVKNVQDYLKNNGYTVKEQYVVWLQGESDALEGITYEEYMSNMDRIIRPLFISGCNKVFIITPGRTISREHFFDSIIDAQIDMCRKSGYYALASTLLCDVSTQYMVDEWHYNQHVLNLLGTEAAKAVAYYTNEQKEMCIYDYKHDNTYIPYFFDYPEDTQVESMDVNGILSQK